MKKQSDYFFEGDKQKYFGLRGKYKYDWIQDSFLGKKTSFVAQRDRYIGHALSVRKVLIVAALFWIVIGALFWRTAHLQLFTGRDLLLAAESNRFRFYANPAPRGIIYDRNGQALVENIPSFSLSISPKDILIDPKKRKRMQELVGMSDEEAATLLNIDDVLSQESLVVKENLTYEDALRIQVAAADMPGLYLGQSASRNYLLDEHNTLAHVLGYTGKINAREWSEINENQQQTGDHEYEPTDTLGKQGIEKSYEHLLRGVYGNIQVEVDAKGRRGRQANAVQAEPGDSIILSIDAKAQERLAQLMEIWMSRLGKTRGSAVAIDPRNGEVVALVSFPGFDSNAFIGGISQKDYDALLDNEDNPLFGRAVGGRYPSGSTIKPFMAAAALQEGIISAKTSFISNGGLAVSRWFFKDWKAGGHGITNVKKAIAESVNTFFYIVGGGYKEIDGLGVTRINAYLQQFGFGQETGIDIPGESAGFIPSPKWKEETKNEIWYIGDTYNLSIGQGDFLTSPLQMTVATAAVANGGTVFRPRLVRGIASSGGVAQKIFDSEITNTQFIQPEYVQMIRQGMRQTVLNGTAKHLGGLPINVAGKTGTAQWSSINEKHAWFTSFAPYENPELVLTIMIEEGENGASIGAGIAHDFYLWWSGYRLTNSTQ